MTIERNLRFAGWMWQWLERKVKVTIGNIRREKEVGNVQGGSGIAGMDSCDCVDAICQQ